MSIKSQKDFFSGLMFMVVGGGFAWGATTYNVGTGARMGPGYFPLVLGVVLAILGAAITFKAMVVETETGDKIGAWAWKPIFFVLGANLLFGVLLAASDQTMSQLDAIIDSCKTYNSHKCPECINRIYCLAPDSVMVKGSFIPLSDEV